MLDLDLLIVREENNNGMFVCLKPKIPALITPNLVENIRNLQDSLAEKYLSHSFDNYFYVIWYLENYSKNGSHGLDFSFILQCIKNHSDDALEYYISRVFNLIFLNYIGLGLPIINCSIINRVLTGICNDFFLLNKICFIHDKSINQINRVDVSSKFSNLVFNRSIYDKNHYFSYYAMQIDKIRTIIEEIPYEIPSEEEINRIRLEFDALKKETLLKIYDIASYNIKILERLGRMSRQ